MPTGRQPAPRVHDAGCERAAQTRCKCSCRSMLHQRTILVEAVTAKPKGTLAAFDAELDDLYGSAFTSLTADPVPPQHERGGRKWAPISSFTPAKQLHPLGQLASQIE